MLITRKQSLIEHQTALKSVTLLIDLENPKNYYLVSGLILSTWRTLITSKTYKEVIKQGRASQISTKALKIALAYMFEIAIISRSKESN